MKFFKKEGKGLEIDVVKKRRFKMKVLKKCLAGLLAAGLVAVGVGAVEASPSGYVDITGGSRMTSTKIEAGGYRVETLNHQDNSVTTYNEYGNAIQTEQAGDIIADYDYENGQLQSVTNQYGDTTFYEHGKQRHTEATRPDTYDGEQVFNDEDGYYYHDEDGNRIDVAEEDVVEGERYTKTTYNYDSKGRFDVVETENWDETQSKTTYNYDGNFLLSTNQQQMVDGEWSPGQTTHYDKGRQSHTVDNDTGETVAEYHYDGVQMEAVSNYDNDEGGLKSITFYDKYGRPDKIESFESATFSEDMLGDSGNGQLQVNYVYDGARLVQIHNHLNNSVVNVDDYGNQGDPYRVDWELPDANAYDPWTKGELAIVEGQLAFLVDEDDVEGRSFYEMDPASVTGETKKTEDGRSIFILNIEEEETEAALRENIGNEINLMWQYYSKSDAENSKGYGWLHIVSKDDRRVNSHLQSDNYDKVTQWGGDWSRDTQYVILD